MRFLSRRPAGEFWTDVVQLYFPQEIGSIDLLLSAVAEHLGPRGRVRLDEVTDHDLATIAVFCADAGLIPARIPMAIVEGIEKRLDREGGQIHFSEEHRRVLDALIREAMQAWRRR
jgi:hypothetical protein